MAGKNVISDDEDEVEVDELERDEEEPEDGERIDGEEGEEDDEDDDSVLKYSVSCRLFLEYPNKHEGQLSGKRSWAVCNSTLHKYGTDRKLQGYIRNSAFDPRRWIAPGQRLLLFSHCDHGLDTPEVPLHPKFQTEDVNAFAGWYCDRGHRWICSKTTSDCVEALVGAYYVGGGLDAALKLMKWFGLDAELDPSKVDEAIKTALLHSYSPKAHDIETLEKKVGGMYSKLRDYF